MYRFNIDINPIIQGREVHLEGVCKMLSLDTFKVTMSAPYKGLSVTKHFSNIEEMDMDATFSQVENDLIKLYEQGEKAASK